MGASRTSGNSLVAASLALAANYPRREATGPALGCMATLQQ
jgi:hypothetical protein